MDRISNDTFAPRMIPARTYIVILTAILWVRSVSADGNSPFEGLDRSGTPQKAPRVVDPVQESFTRTTAVYPDHSGRPAASPGASEALAWIPRVLLYPIHITVEYGIRIPLVKSIEVAEKFHVFERIKHFFSFDDSRGGQGSVFPTFFVDFGRNPAIGLYANYKNFFGSRHTITLQTGFFPDEWIHIVATDSFPVFRDDSGTVTARIRYLTRPDYVFNGIGNGSRQEDESFFRLRELESELSLRAALGGLSRAGIGVFYRTRNASDSDFGRSVLSVPTFDVGDSASVPGWNDSYHLFEIRSRLELDSRAVSRDFSTGSGLRLELFNSAAIDPRHPRQIAFIRWGAEAVGFWDISGINHVLAFRIYAEALESFGNAPLPFLEFIQLGGNEYLRAFLAGRFRGESSLVYTIDYRYPLWAFLDANLFVSLGNVFDGHWRRLHPRNMVLSSGFGLRTNTSRDVSFDVLVAFGTNQLKAWKDGIEVDDIRFLFGVNQGF